MTGPQCWYALFHKGRCFAFPCFAEKLSVGVGMVSGLNKKRCTIWGAGLIALAVFFWPLLQGETLRTKAAQRLLDRGWNPAYQVLPMLALAYDRSNNNPADTGLLDQVWPRLLAFKGTHPEFFWLTLSVLEQRAGRKTRAREALKRARAMDPRIVNMVKGPQYLGYRRAVGLGG